MFRQIRMNRWRADAPEGDVRNAIAALATLAAQIPEVRGWYQAETASAGDDDFDFVIVVDFDDEQAYQRYLRHPAHIHIVSRLVRPVLASTVRIRCGVGSEAPA
jgi:heme-degrading monooxygenase HmoA